MAEYDKNLEYISQTEQNILKEHFDFVPLDKTLKIADTLLSHGLTFGEEAVKE